MNGFIKVQRFEATTVTKVIHQTDCLPSSRLSESEKMHKPIFNDPVCRFDFNCRVMKPEEFQKKYSKQPVQSTQSLKRESEGGRGETLLIL